MVNIKDVMALNVATNSADQNTAQRKDLYDLLTDPDFDQYWNDQDPTKNIVTLDRIQQLIIEQFVTTLNLRTLIGRYPLLMKFNFQNYVGPLTASQQTAFDALKKDLKNKVTFTQACAVRKVPTAVMNHFAKDPQNTWKAETNPDNMLILLGYFNRETIMLNRCLIEVVSLVNRDRSAEETAILEEIINHKNTVAIKRKQAIWLKASGNDTTNYCYLLAEAMYGAAQDELFRKAVRAAPPASFTEKETEFYNTTACNIIRKHVIDIDLLYN